MHGLRFSNAPGGSDGTIIRWNHYPVEPISKSGATTVTAIAGAPTAIIVGDER
jgi:hypothetical protein